MADFGLEYEEVGLQLAYEAVADRTDRAGRTRERYLKERFTNCTFGWQEKLSAIRWSKIWTLNIGDVVEQAYAGQAKPARQTAETYSWTSLYQDATLAKDAVQIVHLHGYAEWLGQPAHPLVF